MAHRAMDTISEQVSIMVPVKQEVRCQYTGTFPEQVRKMATSPSPPLQVLPSEDELLAECKALILYVARHGNVLGTDKAIQDAYDSLVDAVRDRDWPKLKKNYALVTSQTNAAKGINGRSVLDTLTFGSRPDEPGKAKWKKCLRWLNPCNWAEAFHGPRRPMAIGLICFAAALALQAAVGWAGRVSDPVRDLQGGPPGLLLADS